MLNDFKLIHYILFYLPRFSTLPNTLCYHLFKLLYVNVNEAESVETNVLCLRTLLTKGVGARIIVFLNDLDLMVCKTAVSKQIIIIYLVFFCH